MYTFVCCLCGRKVYGTAHDPYPLQLDGMCCTLCNIAKVVPERIRRINEEKKRNEQRNKNES